ncbi:hypothetical protein BS17DRAFT_768380 [Gyrodon lividus]|nr:hypothetical protein BS17DRAFT_768380 [Gyrodon lividus]
MATGFLRLDFIYLQELVSRTIVHKDRPASKMILPRTNLVESRYPQVVWYTLCFGLMGVLAVQGLVYFTRFTEDRTAVKALVIVILVLETLMTIFAFHEFWMASTHFDNEYFFTQTLMLWSYTALAPMTGLVVMTLSLLQLASIIYLDLTLNSSTERAFTISLFLVTWLGSSAICDLTITICMMLSVCLVRHPGTPLVSSS